MFYKQLIDLVDKYSFYKKEVETKKKNGINNFNPILVLRKKGEEVGLHSQFIYSLIDPNAEHYQDTLFLDLFIKDVLGFDDFGTISSVEREYIIDEQRRIDFVIQSDRYKIAIEMKIYAVDQKNQISDYLKDMQSKIETDEDNEAQVYYLTLYGKKASQNSHNNVDYKRVSFQKHILNWLNSCQNEIKNNNNLKNICEAIEQYKIVVEKLTNQYKDNIMDFSQTLENKEDKKTLFELGQNIHKYQGEILDKFFEELKEILPFENIDNKIDKKLMVSKNRCINWFLYKDKDFATFFKINDNYLFCVFLGKSNLHFGIVKHQNFKILNIEKDELSFNELQFRGFKIFHWYSMSYELYNNLDLIVDFNNSKIYNNEIKNLIENINLKV